MATFLISSNLMMLVIALLLTADILPIQANVETSKIYIVYMGERQHDDVELITSSHHDLLASVLGSKEAAVSSMVYSYRHGFSGFAAKLTKRQAQIVAELPDVVDVIPNRIYKFHTTRSWDYLDVSSASTINRYKKLQTNWDYLNLSSNSLPNAKLPEEDVIIGVIDSGVWPESASFKDQGLGEIPSKWKGSCVEGVSFDPKENCNNKLIGARFYYKGVEDEIGKHPFNPAEFYDFLSARDGNGHGTHVASIAAGSSVNDVSFEGLASGTARGGAPRARLAVYKVGWGGQYMASADVCKAFDDAIHDGVDVLSVSFGSGIIPLRPETDKKDLIYYGSFHAVAKAGITVVCAAGNSGPVAQTVENIAPWVITVAATTIDRSFPTSITLLGDHLTDLTGQAMFYGEDTGFVGLTFNESGGQPPPCEYLSPLSNTADMSGKVVLCFTTTSDSQSLVQVINNFLTMEPKPLGIIIAGNAARSRDIHSFAEATPRILVSYDVGTHILNYIRSSRESSNEPKVRIQPSRTYNGVSTYVSGFSSRGPNPLSPSILKPDIAAPGADILAAVFDGYGFKSGTSMATPHVSGIVALLKSLHPDWSPAAIKSALVTTAWTNDPYSKEPIFAEGDVTRIANPFDFGGGLVNYNRAKDPGLVYDLGIEEYTDYLCSMGYNRGDIKDFTGKSCPGKITSVLDLNLPSITIPNLSKTPVDVTRTVTNVGADPNSKYKAIIETPDGITVTVNPDNLIFTPENNKIPFTVSIATTHQVTTKYYFGSLTWTDGNLHKVKIPLSIRSEFPIK